MISTSIGILGRLCNYTTFSLLRLFPQVTSSLSSNFEYCNMSSEQSVSERFRLPKRGQGIKPSVWVQYGTFAHQYKPLNLGMGYPDYPVPKYITDTLAAVASGPDHLLNQYTRSFGHPRLCAVLSALYSQLIGRKIDPFRELLITSGAFEALSVSIQGHVEEGDEVIVIEPFFDCYERMVTMAGGVVRFIPLRMRASVASTESNVSSADWVLDDVELAALFNAKTKAIILNTPNNPLGKMYNREELTKIADLCKKHNVLCISDEVYEWMVYDGNEHVRMCTLPGMWERTITIGSAGKTFSVTGWKTGWAYGPANLLFNLQMMHQNTVSMIPTPLQEAIAICLETELKRLDSDECYFNALPIELKAKRDYLIKIFTDVGMRVVIPQGGYFLMADWTRLADKVDLTGETDAQKDFRFTKWLIKNVGLQGIPPSVFYGQDHKALIEDYVRYCFFKKDENLQKAEQILKNWVNKE